jgi:hypothetical protein
VKRYAEYWGIGFATGGIVAAFSDEPLTCLVGAAIGATVVTLLCFSIDRLIAARSAGGGR